MCNENLENEYKGSKFTVVHCVGAIESYKEALSHVNARKQKSFTRAMILQIKRLADGHRMSTQNFPQEGVLPKEKGQQNSKKFNALKRIPLRGYCWLSEQLVNTYFISHYVYKDYGKLKESDTKRVGKNWKRIEENGDER